jgi:hypothetical protein
MIKGRRASFEARCRERGYDLATAWSCVVEEDGDFITVDETHPAYPRSSTAPPPPFQRPSGGAGTELKALLSKIGITASPTCSCNKRAMLMDANGIEWCEQNVETICDWLAEESAKRKLPFVRLAGKALIHLAIRRAKKGNNK